MRVMSPGLFLGVTRAGLARLYPPNVGSTLRTASAIFFLAFLVTWAGVMLALGFGILLHGPSQWPIPRLTSVGIGLALVAGGQFLFMAFVADRAFPRANRRLVLGVECVTLLVFLAGVAAAVAGWVVASGDLG